MLANACGKWQSARLNEVPHRYIVRRQHVCIGGELRNSPTGIVRENLLEPDSELSQPAVMNNPFVISTVRPRSSASR